MYDLPARPEGTAQQQILQLWDYLFQLVPRINAEQDG